jgi:hypothetical protein
VMDERQRIDMVPGRCMAAVGYEQQCSRRATYRRGELIVCTQHYEMIADPNHKRGPYDPYPDLFDWDGYGWAGHGVLKRIPPTVVWERVSFK